MEKARKDLKSSADKAIEKATADDKDFFSLRCKSRIDREILHYKVAYILLIFTGVLPVSYHHSFLKRQD